MTLKTSLPGYKNEDDHAHLKRIADKHAASERLIGDICQTELGSEAKVTGRIMQGEASAVYTVNHLFREYILRINRSAQNRYVSEQWAIEVARERGLPVSEVISVGRKEFDNEGVNYSLQQKVEGQLFDKLLWVDKISQIRAKKITEQAGELLAKLHGIEVDGWGPIEKPNKGTQDKLRWINDPIDRANILCGTRATKYIAASELQKAAELVKKIEQKENPILLHSDYAPKHIFVNEKDEICGIIDFEDCEAGIAAQEFATWRFWFEESVPTLWLRKGYEHIKQINSISQIDLIELRGAIFTLDYYVSNAKLDSYAKRTAERMKVLIQNLE